MRRNVFIIVAFVLLLFAAVTGIFRFLLFPVAVQSDSMNPGTDRNSLLLVTPLASVERGDTVLVSARAPKRTNTFLSIIDKFVSFATFQQLAPFSSSRKVSETESLRRVVGMPGDTLYMKEYVLYVKPAGSSHFLTEFELSPTAYDIQVQGLPAAWDPSLGVAGEFAETTLKDGEYFLLCDNRISGIDSRVWGVVPKSDIAGRAVLQYFPLNQFGLR